MKPRNRPLRCMIAAVATVGALACAEGPEQRSSRSVSVGAPAPRYAAQTLEGAPVSLQDQQGKVVLLNIWATWCKPCREEIPALEALHQRHASDGLLVAGVSIDQPGESEKIASFANALGVTYTLWHDSDDKVSTTFLAIGVPASYLIDRGGVLRWRHVGPVKEDDPSLNEALRAALQDTVAVR